MEVPLGIRGVKRFPWGFRGVRGSPKRVQRLEVPLGLELEVPWGLSRLGVPLGLGE